MHPFSCRAGALKALRRLLVLSMLALTLFACGGGPPPTAPPAAAGPPAASPGQAPARGPGKKVPADHVREKKGALHKPGMKDPLSNCASCHGQDLKGGPGAPSCYACHEKNWH
ncbi:MAG: hypothetical protein KA419_01785 [Acidobacteria bacterium]|nr:hypothetical protein [Acidobacteriota bacterium]